MFRVEYITNSCDDFTNNFIPYFSPDAVSVNSIDEGLFVDGLIDNDRKEASKNIFNSSLECKNHIVFMIKRAEKLHPFVAAHTYIAHVREYCTSPRGLILYLGDSGM